MKRVVSMLIVFLLCTSLISAAGVEISLDKEEFYQSELLQAEILGTFLENLELENVGLYEGDKVHTTPLASENLLKLENKYLYYAILPGVEGNYSLRIEDAEYYIGQETSEESVEINITIVATTDEYIAPAKGFISATDDFSISVKSLNAVQEITAKFKATGESISKEIGYNAEKTFSFSIDEITEYTESSLEIGDFSIPVYVYPKDVPPDPFIEDPGVPEETPQDTIGEPEKVTYEKATPAQRQTCADIDAQICKKGEKCAGQTTFAEDVVCCLGDCEEKATWVWIIGVIILVVLGVGGFWIYKKVKKEKRPGSEQEAMEQKAKKYKLRMGLDTTNPQAEVRKSLTRE